MIALLVTETNEISFKEPVVGGELYRSIKSLEERYNYKMDAKREGDMIYFNVDLNPDNGLRLTPFQIDFYMTSDTANSLALDLKSKYTSFGYTIKERGAILLNSKDKLREKNNQVVNSIYDYLDEKVPEEALL